MWLEAFLAGDDDVAQRYSEDVRQMYELDKMFAVENNIAYENPLIDAFNDGNIMRFRELLNKTYAENMKKLKNAGVVPK